MGSEMCIRDRVYVESSRNHKPGDLITVKIVASDEYDLYGVDAD